jgi:aspartate/methionine/tyrosine aminotransferase
MNAIPFSGIRKVFEEVIRLENAGEKIIHLSIGRPDFDTPNNIKGAAKKALDEGKVHYASNFGIQELRDAIVEKTERENDILYDPGEIIVTVGANEGVLLAMMALLNPGDEVLIPDPVWLHYFYCAQMAGAVPISVPAREDNGFIANIKDFKTRITPKTKMIVLTSPNNPTGAVAGAEDLEELARFAKENDLFVISDEIYESMVYDGVRHISIASLPGMKERTITVNGFSKKYSMTGWRLGWVASDQPLISAMIRIHQYTTVCVTTFAQFGAVEALTGPQDEIRQMIAEFDRRRNFVYSALSDMPGVTTLKPKGAFYIFPNIKAAGKSSEALTKYLLEEAKIAVVPGSVFGKYGEGYIRISYANSYENLEIAMSNMKLALENL